MNVLVLNAGSSSLKCSLQDTDGGAAPVRLQVERIGEEVPDHRAALERCLAELPPRPLDAIGHRVVHGGERFRKATRLDRQTLTELAALSPLAPLHNPPALACIEAVMALLPGLPNVAVFDTAFHATLPPRAYLYAVPERLYTEHGVRRYGFHGTSHAYVARRAAELLGRERRDLKLVTLHLGNGASACAVLRGESMDTSMGFTPQEGLVMGTRSGDLDPGVVTWLAARGGVEATSKLLNRESGMLGLGGASDLRDIHRAIRAGDEWAARALEVNIYRIVKTVGAYTAALQGLDGVVFTGGVGENDAVLRAGVMQGLAWLGLVPDEAANTAHRTRVSAFDSRVAALVIPTDEEGEIARQTAALLSA